MLNYGIDPNGFDDDLDDERSSYSHSEDDEPGCLFPKECLMPGCHHKSECHTLEMLEQYWAHETRRI
ncbi:MAG: hypothetical protein M3Y56_11515 [Armatimonadota bacterium]|nr:hypothetical protein [Armatimonadota bacterium]